MSRRQLDNLSPDAARILRIWERSRPHAVRALRKSGRLRERLEAVAQALAVGRDSTSVPDSTRSRRRPRR